ncbi:MAG: PAS domain-containing protein, partial [Rhodospirillales bacterium]|nr:PAS domain-containing protein [Rhodospirillales bacterium]
QDVTEHAIDAQNLQKAQETLEETVKQRTSELAEANKQLLAEIARHEQTENSLVLSEQRFKDFAGAASDWLYELDKDFRYTYISESHERITNIQLKKSIGKTPWEITSIPPDEEDNWEVLRQQLKRHEPVHEFEHRHISKNGNIYHGRTSAVPVFSENGEFMGYRGTVTDTTSRRRADQRLKDLHSAIDMIDERISLYDENDGIIFCNASFRKLNAATPEVLEEGVTLEEQLRAGIKKGLIPEAIGREEDWLAKRMELHRNPRGPIEVERQDGITLRIREQKLPDGKSILISSNVGHERRAKVDIEYANRTKKEFLANMSHELRTPLNAILGFSEFMLHEVSGPIGNEQYKDYINDIHESGKLLIQIISDILDISKIEARETVIEEEQNNPADIINACVRIIKGRADIADVAMKVDIQEGLPDFMADNRQIKQILLNLMSNAVKFSHSGCTVTVSAHFRDDLGIEIRVTDEGIGIAKEDLHQIMEPFHQVRSSQEHSHGGTGLGLAIAKSMINLHGGNLVLQSKLGKGTTAIISLPRERMILG